MRAIHHSHHIIISSARLTSQTGRARHTTAYCRPSRLRTLHHRSAHRNQETTPAQTKDRGGVADMAHVLCSCAPTVSLRGEYHILNYHPARCLALIFFFLYFFLPLFALRCSLFSAAGCSERRLAHQARLVPKKKCGGSCAYSRNWPFRDRANQLARSPIVPFLCLIWTQGAGSVCCCICT